MTSSTVSSESVARQEPIPQLCQIKVWKGMNGETSSETSEELLNKPTKIPKPKKNEDHDREREDPCHSDIPEWLQELRKSCG